MIKSEKGTVQIEGVGRDIMLEFTTIIMAFLKEMGPAKTAAGILTALECSGKEECKSTNIDASALGSILELLKQEEDTETEEEDE